MVNSQFQAIVGKETKTSTYAKRLLSVLSMMAEDSSELCVQEQVFSFTEINPGLGALGLASMNVGGVPHGAALVSPMAYSAFRTNRGSDSTIEPDVPVDLTLVNLPFSAFVGVGHIDPAISKIISAAAERRHETGCTLFRVDWTIGQRLGLNPSVYSAAISRH